MKAIFLNSSDTMISRVFTEATQAKIREKVELLPEVVKPTDLVARKGEFDDVDFIFSTWGILSVPTDAEKVTPEMLADYFPNLRAVFYGAGTVKSFAKGVHAQGAKVFSAWAANAVPVAEFIVAQIILANTGYFQSAVITKGGKWGDGRKIADKMPHNYDIKVGLIGCGMIGSLVARMLKSYSFEVLAHDPFMSAEKAADLGVKSVSLEEIFSECFTISNHLPDIAKTKNMLNYDLFKLMKPNGNFINTGRGAQVREYDLIRALVEEPGRTALLDVTAPEPPKPLSPLFTMPNIFLTPHIAGSMGNEVARMGDYVTEEFLAFVEGKETRYEVTPEMLETMA